MPGWAAAVFFLTALEVAYCASVAVVGLGIPVLGWRLWAGWRHGKARPMTAQVDRMVSIFISLLAAEAACAVWTSLNHRPGRRSAVETRPSAISMLDLVTPVEAVKLPTRVCRPAGRPGHRPGGRR